MPHVAETGQNATGFAARCRNDAQIIRLQGQLLDHTGHVRADLARAEAQELVAEINRLHAENGWKPLDMAGRWRAGPPDAGNPAQQLTVPGG